MDVELQVIMTDGSNGAAPLSPQNVLNGEDVGLSIPEANDDRLPDPTAVGETTPLNGGPPAPTSTPRQESLVCRAQRELNRKVFWKVRLWMVVILIFVLIVAIILVTLTVCAAIHEDEDEKYDPSLFRVLLLHNGSFQLPNQVFTQDPSNLNSNKSQVLAAQLQEKIAGLYSSSPALGRYFSEALVNVFRNGSVVADYQLRFLTPEEEGEQLRQFTLSREVVFNVFRQFLHDQEGGEAAPLYIAPDSLRMS